MTKELVPERRPNKRLTKGMEAEILVGVVRSMVNGGYISAEGFRYRLGDAVFIAENVGEEGISADENLRRAMKAESISEAIERRISPKGK